MLTHVVVHQPEDPIAYFHEELSRMKQEVEENNVRSLLSVCVLYLHTYTCVYALHGTILSVDTCMQAIVL